MEKEIKYLPVVFDKSHLLTIGERLYSTSLDLIRELVSNAYDADATVINIDIRPEMIVVEDNGSGMDEDALRQYFTIGSQEKRIHSFSPTLKRKRIGEFGIGKFSVLTLAECFCIETQQVEKRFRARLTFDAKEWKRDPHSWKVPCEILPFEAVEWNGTRVTITKIKKNLEPAQVVRAVRERLPIGREDFRIFVNGNEVTATTIPGKRFPVYFETPFGDVRGEIILANLPQTQQHTAEAGITIRVKHISVMRSLFGFEMSRAVGLSRIRGWINADFLPITSSRDALIQDSDEYQWVYEKMHALLRGALREARNLAFAKENMRASEALRNALDKIGRAFKKNPGLLNDSVFDPPLGETVTANVKPEEGYIISKAQFVDSASLPLPEGIMPALSGEKKHAVRRKHAILANRAIIRKLHFQHIGLICRMDRFGSNYPPSFREQGIIFINIDHPLYSKQAENPGLLMMFISTLLTKEIALEKYPYDVQEAYALQYQLLTDAFKDVRQL